MKSFFKTNLGLTTLFILFTYSLNIHAVISNTHSRSCPDLRKASEDSLSTSRSESLNNLIEASVGIIETIFSRFKSEKKFKDDQSHHERKYNIVDFDKSGRPVFLYLEEKDFPIDYHNHKSTKPSYKWRPDELYTPVEQKENGKLVFNAYWRNQSGIDWLFVEPEPLIGHYHSAE